MAEQYSPSAIRKMFTITFFLIDCNEKVYLGIELSCQPMLTVQVTIQEVEIKDFANTAINIQQSEAVAIMETSLQTDLDLEGLQGIVVDASKRVFIGKTTVKCSGHCISAINRGQQDDTVLGQNMNYVSIQASLFP